MFLKWEIVFLCISCTCLTPCFLVLGRCCPNCYCMDSCSVAWEKRKDYIKHNYWYVAFSPYMKQKSFSFEQIQKQGNEELLFYDVKYLLEVNIIMGKVTENSSEFCEMLKNKFCCFFVGLLPACVCDVLMFPSSTLHSVIP